VYICSIFKCEIEVRAVIFNILIVKQILRWSNLRNARVSTRARFIEPTEYGLYCKMNVAIFRIQTFSCEMLCFKEVHKKKYYVHYVKETNYGNDEGRYFKVVHLWRSCSKQSKGCKNWLFLYKCNAWDTTFSIYTQPLWYASCCVSYKIYIMGQSTQQ
jgi:hypothetical protein